MVQLSGSNDGTVRVWDADPHSLLPTTVPTGAPIWSAALSPDGKLLATCGDHSRVRLWDAATGTSQGSLVGTKTATTAAVFSPAGGVSLLAMADTNCTVQIWDETHRKMIARFRSLGANDRPSNGVCPMAFSGDGEILLVAGKAIGMWWTASWRPLGRIATRYVDRISRMTVSSMGDIVAATGHDKERGKYGDGTVELWSMRGPRPQWFAAIRGAHDNDILALAFSPDGKTLATGGWDRSIQLWDVARLHGEVDGRKLKPVILNDQAGPVNCLAFPPDRKELYAGNEDHTIRVWDLETHEEHGVLSGHPGPVNGLFFSDADTLVSTSADGTIRFWRAAPFSRTDEPLRVQWGRKL